MWHHRNVSGNISRNKKACTGLTKPSPSTMPLMRFTGFRRHQQAAGHNIDSKKHQLTCIGLGAFSSNCCHSTLTEVRAGWKALDSCDFTLLSHFDLVFVSKNSSQPAPTLAMERRKWRLAVELCVCVCMCVFVCVRAHVYVC